MQENVFKVYSEHRHLYLFKTDRGSVLFKPLEYSKCRIAERICAEYPSISVQIEDNIWEECVVEHSFPHQLHEMDAGLPSTVVALILRISAPRSIESLQEDLEKARNGLTDIRDDIVAKICEAFPAYTPEVVEDMDWQTQIKRLAQAEKVLQADFSVSNDQAPAETEGVKMKMSETGEQFVDFGKENAYIQNGD